MNGRPGSSGAVRAPWPLVLVLFCAGGLLACAGEGRIDLSGEWELSRYERGRSPSVPPSLEATSSSVELPGRLPALNAEYWLQKEVFIPAGARGRRLAVSAGTIADTEATYLNGELIGADERPEDSNYTAFSVHRHYFLPSGSIRYGAPNVIALRVVSDSRAYVYGRLFIGDLNDVRLHAYWINFYRTHLLAGVLLCTLLMVVLSLMLYFSSRESHTALYFAGLCLLYFLANLRLGVHPFFYTAVLPERGVYFASIAMSVLQGAALYWFLEHLFELRFRIARYAVTGVAAVLALLCILAIPLDLPRREVFRFVGWGGLVSFATWVFVLGTALARRKNYSVPILVGMSIYIVTLVHDVLFNAGRISFGRWTPYGFMAMLVAFQIIIAGRSQFQARLLKGLSGELQRKNDSLAEVGQQVGTLIDDLSRTASDGTSTMDSLHEQMTDQAATLEQISAALEEVLANINHIADNSLTQDLAVRSNQTFLVDYLNASRSITRIAGGALDLSAKRRTEGEGIRDSLRDAHEKMNELREQSGNIQEITGMISDVADRTNLLALNAAIEAARAGDQGRGFAVVAEEIGRLADTSAVQSRNIQEILTRIIQGIETESKLVEIAVERLTVGEEGLLEIEKVISEVLDLCNQQARTTNDIEKNMELIGQGSSNISNAVSEEKTAISETTRSVQRLSEIMSNVVEHSATLRESVAALAKKIDNVGEISKRSL